jgi:DnaJ-domain-containing protein 1
MSERPYMRSTIVELEALFAVKLLDTDTLDALKTELQFRNVPRAISLLAKVKVAMSEPKSLALNAQPSLFVDSPSAGLPRLSPVVFPTESLPESGEAPKEVASVSIDEAYRLLRVTSTTPWENIEQARDRLVRRSHPDALEGLSAEKQVAALADARQVNAAYAALAEERRRGSE